MRTSIYIFIFIFGKITMSCSPLKVVDSNSNPEFEISDYYTYNFFNIEPSGDTVIYESEGYFEDMDVYKTETSKQLANLGLTRNQRPQLLVDIKTLVEEKSQTREVTTKDGTIYTDNWKKEEIEIDRYKVGKINIKIIDRATKNLVWIGLTGVVLLKVSSQIMKKNIQKL